MILARFNFYFLMKACFFLILLHILFGCVSPQGFKRPEVLDCTILSTGELFCIKGKDEVIVSPGESAGYRCTTIDDELAVLDYMDSIEKRLRKCLLGRSCQ